MAKNTTMDPIALRNFLASGAYEGATEEDLPNMNAQEVADAWKAYVSTLSPAQKEDGRKDRTPRTCHVILFSEGSVVERASVDNTQRLEKADLVATFETMAAFRKAASVLVLVESEGGVEVVGATADDLLSLLSR